MTNLFFADEPVETLKISTPGGEINMRDLEVRKLPSIWNK
jgi:hypothetical protein